MLIRRRKPSLKTKNKLSLSLSKRRNLRLKHLKRRKAKIAARHEYNFVVCQDC
ncbi:MULTISPECIES: hypothetical protein [Basfia]|uniref:Uncharacterized protein n=2 Tax=Basfia TaxID=697331 RepID=Q65RJ4_MANSM|nr:MULTISPECIES: hypothetical protein [Basfia]AAU38416.1 unknown [[Mannheimia] succiniciproducens MBEL55E]SCY20186.1 hypothetical protein SAMN02910354_01832 [Basfia succiniciproducens]SEQ45333.1 hypothetical protein SAMN02910415_01483 [Basfia succiniciproducens]